MKITSNSIKVHCLSDYCSMFALDEQSLRLSILDYPAGISSFNAEMHMKGFDNVVSADRHYDLSPMDMVKHVDFVIQNLSENFTHLVEQKDEDALTDTEDLLNRFNRYAQKFLNDYSAGQQDGRYQVAKLPQLPFSDGQFELALCTNLIFRTQYNTNEVVNELTRVAKEVRIFPLLDLSGEIATDLGPLMLTMQQLNFGIEVKEVKYHLNKKSNAMLKIWAKECAVS